MTPGTSITTQHLAAAAFTITLCCVPQIAFAAQPAAPDDAPAERAIERRGNDEPIARNDDPDDANETPGEQTPSHYDWSVGAGIGITGFGGLGGLNGPGSQLLTVMVERRLGQHVWLMGGARASYNRWEQGSPGASYQSNSETLGFGGATGLRIVINPDDPFQFSGHALLGYEMARQQSEYAYDGVAQLDESRSWRATGRVGGAIERELIAGFGVRLVMDLGQLGYGPTEHSSFVNGINVGGDSSGGWSAGLALSPSLEARLKF